MKTKITLIFVAFFLFNPNREGWNCFGQPKNVVSAYNYLQWGELDKAKEAIDLAAAHEQTSGKAKTWFYRALIYQQMLDPKNEKFKGLDPNPLQAAFESYKKAAELDAARDYTNEIHRGFLVCENQFINKGVGEFNNRDFKSALVSFENAVAASKMPSINKLDTLALYNAALAAEKIAAITTEKLASAADDQSKAALSTEKNNYLNKAAAFYNELISVKYGGAKTYLFIAKVYKALGDTAKALSKVQEGRTAYAKDNNLQIEECNFYLQSGKNNEAVECLKKAIELAPDNHNVYWALGSIYDQIGDVANGEVTYKQGLALVEKYYEKNKSDYEAAKGKEGENEARDNFNKIKEDYFNITYNLGALYYNDGVNKIKVANEIKDLVKYNKEKKAAEDIMIKALPFLEKALELNPRDRNTLLSLKELYARMSDKVNYDRINELLKN